MFPFLSFFLFIFIFIRKMESSLTFFCRALERKNLKKKKNNNNNNVVVLAKSLCSFPEYENGIRNLIASTFFL